MNAINLLLIPLLLQDPQDAQATKSLSLVYQNGTSATAEVLALEGDKVTLRVHVLGGHMQVTRTLSDFTPPSAFRIEEASAQPSTFEEYFSLAKRAVHYGLVPQAGAKAGAALDLVEGTAEEQAKTAEVRGWAADALEDLLKEAIADGELSTAEHYLKLLSTRLSDQRTEEQLDALAAAVDTLDQAMKEKKQAARQQKMDARAREAVVARLKPIHAAIRRGDELHREAVSKSRKTVASSRLCDRAIEAYRAAWKATEALVKQYPNDDALAREAEAIGNYLHDHGIRAALHAANMLTVQSDYKGAMEWAQRILAYDPDNAEAKEMVRTIQIAAAEASRTWGWGWRIVDPRPRRPRGRGQ